MVIVNGILIVMRNVTVFVPVFGRRDELVESLRNSRLLGGSPDQCTSEVELPVDIDSSLIVTVAELVASGLLGDDEQLLGSGVTRVKLNADGEVIGWSVRVSVVACEFVV